MLSVPPSPSSCVWQKIDINYVNWIDLFLLQGLLVLFLLFLNTKLKEFVRVILLTTRIMLIFYLSLFSARNIRMIPLELGESNWEHWVSNWFQINFEFLRHSKWWLWVWIWDARWRITILQIYESRLRGVQWPDILLGYKSMLNLSQS